MELFKKWRSKEQEQERKERPKPAGAAEKPSEFVTEMNRKLDQKSAGGREIEELTEKERVFYLTSMFENIVYGDGLYDFFYGYYGRFAYELADAFRAIGAPEVAEVCQRAIEAFGTQIPTSKSERQDLMDNLDESDLESDLKMCEDDFYRLADGLDALRQTYYFL